MAATNPHAWSRTAYTAEEIRTVSETNRMVGFPYPKLMCANIDTDQAAAVLLCSYEAAQRAGVPDDRMVFPVAGAGAHDHYFFSERFSLAESPAIRTATNAALAAAELNVDDVARFDLYSCFPSAVQVAMQALELRGPAAGDTRPLTVTGGLGFAGGPGNNYVTHSIAAMTQACREDPGSLGLVTALGWYITKHSVGIYSTTPPPRGFIDAGGDALQAEVDATPSREPAGAHDGAATVEATSVMFDRDGAPEVAIITALTPDGRRALANSRDSGALRSMVDDGWEGRAVKLRSEGDTNVLVS